LNLFEDQEVELCRARLGGNLVRRMQQNYLIGNRLIRMKNRLVACVIGCFIVATCPPKN